MGLILSLAKWQSWDSQSQRF